MKHVQPASYLQNVHSDHEIQTTVISLFRQATSRSWCSMVN